MSLAIATYVPEGIIMASDSRQSISIEGKIPDGKDFKIETVNSDAVTKTFLLEKQKVGISNFGADLLGGVPMASHIKNFIEEELTERDDVTTIPEKLLRYFKKSFSATDTGFHVAGYKRDGKVSVPYVFYCHIGRSEISRRNVQKDDPSKIDYGATWSGQIDILSGILQPTLVSGPIGPMTMNKPPIVWGAMALQDAIDFSIFAIRTTIDAIRFQARPKNVGGFIDVLAITPDSTVWIQRKELKGEY